MRLDSTHRGWCAFSIVILIAAGALYLHYVTVGAGKLNGPSGGSAVGLTLGIASALCLYYAGLLGIRKSIRTWRFGAAQWWMRGHLWLGTLCLPLAWWHGGVRHGGVLTSIVMWLLYLVVLSGLAGAALQHILPRRLTRAVTGESTERQIPHLLQHLLAQCDHVVMCYCGPLNGAGDSNGASSHDVWRKEQEALIESGLDKYLLDDERAATLRAALATAPMVESEPLKKFYLDEVRPVLSGEHPVAGASVAAGVRGGSPFRQAERTRVRFVQQRFLTAEPLLPALAEIQAFIERRQNFLRQMKYQRWIYLWLFVHVPLAYALMILVALHAVVALRYSL